MEMVLVINCIAEYSNLIAEIEMLSGLTYDAFQKKYPLMPKSEWLELLSKHHFSILKNRPIKDFEFSCIDEFLLFWEATTQGKFKRNDISKDNYQTLLMKYSTTIQLFGAETLSILAVSDKG